MSQSEVDAFLQVLKKYRKELTDDKKKSLKFLTDIGLLTKQGKVKKAYESICIPQDQD